MSFVEPQTIARRKLLQAMRLHFSSSILTNFNNSPLLPAAFFVTDPVRSSDILETAQNLPTGFGILYRHFGREDRFYIGNELKRIATAKRLFLSISEDAHLEKLIQPHGIHWPKSKLSFLKLSARSNRVHTSSAHTFRQITKAEKLKLNACFVSSVFPSKSPTAPKAMGVHRFRQIARQSHIPLYALGGVTNENAAQISTFAGISGVTGFHNQDFK
ncbi:thiamine phosphate synthase [Hirschia litorea]|uniref:Thiamine phosphate synthase n=1 Tax=Hirschia litorea TaxID=1199156 RepID=A0ABW2IMS3_9PROT